MKFELIQSAIPVIPTKGSNAGKEMYVINGKHWSKTAPSTDDTHVCLEDVEVDGNTYTNVVGFNRDSRMSIAEKIKLITSNDVGYAQAIATLLR